MSPMRAIGDEAVMSAVTKGRRMTLDEAIECFACHRGRLSPRSSVWPRSTASPPTRPTSPIAD